jgi:hypothetical protein
LSARAEHRFAKGLYFLSSFTWGKPMGDSEQALEYYAGYVEANPQNIRNLAAERGWSSFEHAAQTFITLLPQPTTSSVFPMIIAGKLWSVPM